MEKFVINLKPRFDEIEFFDIEDKNIAKFSIQLPTGEIVSGKKYRVYMDLSRDAKLGLGIELIRSAIKNGTDAVVGFEHFYPIDKDLASRYFGIYLHPESCELLLSDEEFGTLENLLEKISDSQT